MATKLEQLLASLSDEDKALLVKLVETKEETENKKEENSNTAPAESIGGAVRTGQRPNLFEKSEHFNKFKQDSKTDKLLWGDNTPEERGTRQGTIESTCRKCNKVETVPIALVSMEKDGKKSIVNHTCERCLPRR